MHREFPIGAFERIRLDQRVGGAPDAPGMAEAAQDGAHQGGLAGAEIAEQLDLQPVEGVRGEAFGAHRVERLGEAQPEGGRRGLVGERELALGERGGRDDRVDRMAGLRGHSRKIAR